MDQDRFPLRLFFLYILFYSGQAVYGTYFNLYLAQAGLSQSQIGFTVSASTALLLLAQPLWGVASDRAKYKNSILSLIFLGCAASILLFYGPTGFGYLLTAIAIFTIFYTPVTPLMDNISLELLEDGKWDFGQIRLGGTLGYAVTVGIAGILLENEYSRIFGYIALVMALCFLVCRSLPRIRGYSHGVKRAPYRQLFRYKGMLAMIFFYLCSYIALNFYSNFYPVYFVSIGGDSSWVGLMMFLSAASEVPFLLLIHRIIRRFGLARVLSAAGAVSAMRWLLLSLFQDPALIAATSLLHGFSFISFIYGMATYINDHVPRELRATGQSLNALIMSFFSRVVFGYLGGLFCDMFGTGQVLRSLFWMMIAATGVFIVWFSWAQKQDASQNPPT